MAGFEISRNTISWQGSFYTVTGNKKDLQTRPVMVINFCMILRYIKAFLRLSTWCTPMVDGVSKRTSGGTKNDIKSE